MVSGLSASITCYVFKIKIESDSTFRKKKKNEKKVCENKSIIDVRC